MTDFHFFSKVSLALTLSITVLSNGQLSGQSIKNIVAKSTTDGKVVVTFDLVGITPDQKFSIGLFSSQDNFTLPLSKVNGDVGKNVSSGIGKRIEWEASELGEFKGDVSFKIKGEALALPFVFRSPAKGSSVKRGKKTLVQWTGGRATQNVKINLYKDGQQIQLITDTKNSGSYDWQLPAGLSKGTYTMKLDAGGQVVESGPFMVKSKFPLLIKCLPILVVGGIVATLGGKKDSNQTPSLPAAPDPK